MPRIQINSEQIECAALAFFLQERDIDADDAPAVLPEMVVYIVGRAVTLGMMTDAEAREFINDRLAMRMRVAMDLEIDARYTGNPPGGYAQWPASSGD